MQPAGSYTNTDLEDLAKQPHVTVMKHTHDKHFSPWSSDRVNAMVDLIITTTNEHKNHSVEEIQKICKLDHDIQEFADKYKTIFKKLTNPSFVTDNDNLHVLRKMILLKAAVDRGMISEEEAQAESTDIALKMVMSKSQNKK
jgi:hypothetical protein